MWTLRPARLAGPARPARPARDPPGPVSLSTVLFLFLAHLGVGIAFTLLFVSRDAGVKFFRFNAGLGAILIAIALAFRYSAPAPSMSAALDRGALLALDAAEAVLVLLIMAIGIFAVGGAEGFSLAPLNPVNIFNNDAAIGVFGTGAAGIALFAAFWSWVGFEMAPNYAEESRDPQRIAKIATYASVIGLGLFYIFVSYSYVTGWGLVGSVQAVSDQFAGTYASAFYPLADRFVGGWLTAVLEVLAVTSSFACAMAFFNTSARYLFSLGREGVLPGALARTSRHRSPGVASATVTVLVALYTAAFVVYDPSTE